MEDEEMKMVIEITKEEIVKIIASFYECDESAVDLEVKHEDAGYGTGEYRNHVICATVRKEGQLGIYD